MRNQLEMYKANQAEIVKKYNGKIIAVVDGEVVGVFENKTEALRQVSQKYPPGAFMVIKCTPGDEEYTRRYRSRVILPKEAAV